jgi:HNH endonuclease
MFTQLGEAKVLASEFRQCFYCGGSLPASKKEHIFNSCWGGSHSTTKLICDQCNECYSHSVDSSLSVYTMLVMNAWGFKGERHRQVPEIETAGELTTGKHGKPRQKQPKIIKKNQPDGSSVITGFSFNSKEEAYKFLRSDEILLTADEQKQIRQAISEAKIKESIIEEPQQFSFELDLQDQYRSASHTLLKCLGMYAPEQVRGDAIASVREFTRYNKGEWTSFAVKVNQVVPSAVEMMNATPRCNTAEIYWCRALGKVVGVLTLLGRIRRAVILAEDYSGDTSGMLYVVEDTYGSKKPPRSLFVELDPNVPSFPLLEIQSFAPSDESFGHELGHLLWRSLSVEGPTASLTNGIAKIMKDTSEINEDFFRRYESLFITFALQMERAFGVPLASELIPSKLAEYGFSDLARCYMGKGFEDDEVQSILVKVFEKMYRDLLQSLPR